MRLSALTFERQFLRFAEKVRAHSGGEFTTFLDGLPAEWEEYKERVRNEAIRLLGFRTWKRAEVGTGRILGRIIKAIEINDPARELRNNLVNWPNRYGHQGRSHRALLDAHADESARRRFEQWFLDFFQGRLVDAAAFESVRALAGDCYDLVAYMFFLKDWRRFMRIAPTIFDEAFRLLDVDLVTVRHCSWENYARYNDALLVVQRALRELRRGGWRAHDRRAFVLLDARAAGLPAPPPAVVIPLPTVLTGLQAAPLRPGSFARDRAGRRGSRNARTVAAGFCSAPRGVE